MALTALPRKDADLLNWSNNFDTKLTATPVAYGMTAAQATQYATVATAFATAYAAAINPTTRTKAKIAAKDVARRDLRRLASAFGQMIQANPAVTDEQKIDLGLTVRAVPQPIPAPSTAPIITIVSTVGRTVKIKLKKDSGTGRGKPPGVHGAAVFSYVGATAPTTTMLWHFEGNTNMDVFDVQFPETVAAGAQVWFTAMWFNPRSQSGPPATFITTNLPGGGALPMAA